MNEVWVPRFNPWLIACSVMLATFMEILDTSIANVALPYIAGALSASNSEATWVLTSYLVSNAIVLPASAWFGKRFGRTRFLTSCILLFTVSSALCGVANSLGLLIVARVLQGVGGGALQPMAMAILLESFPPARRGVAMAVYGLGVVVAPIIGPALGGWLTDNYSWRWIFYINLPVGLLAFAMIRAFVEDPPYIRNARAGDLDVAGLSLLTLWLGSLQIVLDKGQEVDWFSTAWIGWLALVSVVSFVALVVCELCSKNPLVDIRVLRNRNLTAATALVTVMGFVLYSGNALLPLFLQELMGYPALQSGLAVVPRGVGAVVGMLLIGRLVSAVDGRLLVGIGFAGAAASSFLLSGVTLDISRQSILLPNIINGLAIAFVFVPLSALGTATLSNEEIGQGTGLYNLMRNIGGSVGIAWAATMLDRSAQMHQNELLRHLTPYDPAYLQTLQQMQQVLGGTVTAVSQATGLMYNTLLQQASFLAFVSTYQVLVVLSVAAIPLVLLMRMVSLKGKTIAAH